MTCSKEREEAEEEAAGNCVQTFFEPGPLG